MVLIKPEASGIAGERDVADEVGNDTHFGSPKRGSVFLSLLLLSGHGA